MQSETAGSAEISVELETRDGLSPQESDEAPDELEKRVRPDMVDFLGALLAGAALGAGLTLLLRPRPKEGMARIRKDLAPYGRRLRKSTRAARRSFAAGADATSEAAEALGQAGRILIQDLREEASEIISEARSDLITVVNEQVGQALESIRLGARKRTGR